MFRYFKYYELTFERHFFANYFVRLPIIYEICKKITYRL